MTRIITGFIFLIVTARITLLAETSSVSVVVGSKKFTENIILGEIAADISTYLGYPSVHRKQLGGTRILWNALVTGEIDIYPEYTGTLRKEILSTLALKDDSQLDSALMKFHIKKSPALGFNNTYVIGVTRKLAAELDLTKISDLKQYPDLVFGFTNEFLDRADGWLGMRERYQLPQQNVRGLDHDLAYRGIASGSIQVIDMYSTDPEIKYYNLFALDDELDYFTKYEAMYLYREDIEKTAPLLVADLVKLGGKISEQMMIDLNAEIKLEHRSEKEVSARFLRDRLSINIPSGDIGLWQRLWDNTKDHCLLVLISLTLAIIVAIPLGILAAKLEFMAKIILGFVGIIQTIPSLALLVFMIPLLGIGGPPAIVALFLYSLLPIVRNTYTGIHDLPDPIRLSAMALGLPYTVRLRLIELPLASRSILAGVKISAVINVGTATLGALIGAGGYGQPILTGIRLDNIGLILEGAIPAALLALFVQWLFDLSEKFLVPKGLRVKVVDRK